MGASSSILESLKASKISEVMEYFDNSALLKGFYTEAKKESSSSNMLCLNGVSQFLAKENVGNTVALYASPFLGAIATSSSCLRQAYITMNSSTSTESENKITQETNLSDIIIKNEDEFKLFLQYLFFYHELYDLFADECFKEDKLTQDKFKEYIEDIVDDDNDSNALENLIQSAYTDLPNKSSFSHLVSWSVTKLIGPDSFLATRTAQGNGQQKRTRRLGKSFTVSMDGNGAVNILKENKVSERVVCLRWHKVSSTEEFLAPLKALPVENFSSILQSDMNCSRVIYCTDSNDPNIIISMYWLTDLGEKFEGYMREAHEEDGLFHTSLSNGVISKPISKEQFVIFEHGGWKHDVSVGDVYNSQIVEVLNENKNGLSAAFQSLQEEFGADVRDNKVHSGSLGCTLEGDKFLSLLHHTADEHVKFAAQKVENSNDNKVFSKHLNDLRKNVTTMTFTVVNLFDGHWLK